VYVCPRLPMGVIPRAPTSLQRALIPLPAHCHAVLCFALRPRRYKTVLNYDQGAPAPRLAPGTPISSPLLLPRSWVMLLRVLLQRGVAEGLFRHLAQLAASSQPSASGQPCLRLIVMDAFMDA
jgi:hypothetical protein